MLLKIQYQTSKNRRNLTWSTARILFRTPSKCLLNNKKNNRETNKRTFERYLANDEQNARLYTEILKYQTQKKVRQSTFCGWLPLWYNGISMFCGESHQERMLLNPNSNLIFYVIQRNDVWIVLIAECNYHFIIT